LGNSRPSGGDASGPGTRAIFCTSYPRRLWEARGGNVLSRMTATACFRFLTFSVAAVAVAALGVGCATGAGGTSFRVIQFKAPSPPDPQLQQLLDDTETIGILSATNIEPLKGLDIEKVMGRLTDATARVLRRTDRKVITQDEIHWHFERMEFDSASVFSAPMQETLREEMEIDALVYVLVQDVQSETTPVSPSPRDLTANPGVNISVDFELSLINLHSGESWSQHRQGKNWQTLQLNLLLEGNSDRGERQLLSALADPLKQFLVRLAPPPTLEARHFDRSGD